MPLDHEFLNNLVKNVLETWVVPELNRREGDGRVPPDYHLVAAQVVMEADCPAEVRLNDEVRGVIYAEEVPPEFEGRDVSVDEFHLALPTMANFELLPHDRPNAGHITIVRHAGGWFAAFDLRYNGARVAELLRAAREFLDAARDSRSAGRCRPLIADLFQAVELLAKARLLLHPDARLLTSRAHAFMRSEYNRFGHHGNTEPRFVQLFNRLFELRNPARYSIEPFQVENSEADEMLRVAEEMHEAARSAAPSRGVRPRSTEPVSTDERRVREDESLASQ
jgi:HEPN domain-containing protein